MLGRLKNFDEALALGIDVLFEAGQHIGIFQRVACVLDVVDANCLNNLVVAAGPDRLGGAGGA